MLRSIGFALAIFSAVSLLVALGSLIADLISQWPYYVIRRTLMIVFSAAGLTVGIILTGFRPTGRGPLFWSAALGCGVWGSVAALLLASYFFFLLSSEDGPHILALFLGPFPTDALWWPPKGGDLIYPLLQMLDSLESYLLASAIMNSVAIWVYAPLAICAWALWGRPGGAADKVFALIAAFLAGLTILFSVATAFAHYEIATYVDPAGTVTDFLYYPEFIWYSLYAVAVLWFVVLAVLLFQRRRVPVEREQPGNATA